VTDLHACRVGASVAVEIADGDRALDDAARRWLLFLGPPKRMIGSLQVSDHIERRARDDDVIELVEVEVGYGDATASDVR
jgi:hypothetical protein